MVFLFGAGDEESAEAPPAAEEARRFRGSVPTAGRGSGWEPADTTVSAEEYAKKSPPKWVVIYVMLYHCRFLNPRLKNAMCKSEFSEFFNFSQTFLMGAFKSCQLAT